MEKYYNSKVKNTSFKPGDLEYRNNDASHTEDTGKLGPKWEGPYEVTEALGKGAYKLRDRDGKQLPRTWNVSNLKKCLYSQNVSNSLMRITRWEIGEIVLAEAKVMDRAVVVSVVAGMTLEVPYVPVKAVTDNGSAKETKTSRRADL
ncbi:hypothetical protein Tco_1124119 [Tanacetum coccineum]|uniref:Tf2-1-like SH3-like domain-containing protein n=1 Tax=Tanacetum coccineum TaxID=301880 RepID=A0ABQ5J5D0_9ASTR